MTEHINVEEASGIVPGKGSEPEDGAYGCQQCDKWDSVTVGGEAPLSSLTYPSVLAFQQIPHPLSKPPLVKEGTV